MVTNCICPSSSENPLIPGSAIQTVSAKTIIVVMKANCFIVSSCPLGKKRSTKAATVGRKMIRLINTVGSERASSRLFMSRSLRLRSGQGPVPIKAHQEEKCNGSHGDPHDVLPQVAAL